MVKIEIEVIDGGQRWKEKVWINPAHILIIEPCRYDKDQSVIFFGNGMKIPVPDSCDNVARRIFNNAHE